MVAHVSPDSDCPDDRTSRTPEAHTWEKAQSLTGVPHDQKDREAVRRRAMVTAVRNGRSQQEVAREFGVSPSTVHHWVQRARGRLLDRVDWRTGRGPPARPSGRIPPSRPRSWPYGGSWSCPATWDSTG